MSFTLRASAGFSLRAAAAFAYDFPGTRITVDEPGTMTFSWALDGDWRTARVILTQHGDEIRGEIDGSCPREFTNKVRRDVDRILCLDVDAHEFLAVGRRDRVVGELQQRFTGRRPVRFCSPYEAAAWCIIGHRIQMSQAASIKQRLADEHGDRGAFPAPARLAGIAAPQRGLTAQKIDQLHHLAAAATDGQLDRTRLRAMTYAEAEQELRRLPGVGPFSAELILIRGMGAPDAFPGNEKRLDAAMREAYGLAPDADLRAVADAWRPYRSWVSFLLRAGSGGART